MTIDQVLIYFIHHSYHFSIIFQLKTVSVLNKAVQEWNIPTALGVPPLVSDNAANMIKAGHLFGCALHIGCLAHTINIGVQKSLKVRSVASVLAKIRHIVSFFHRSTAAAAVLRAKAELLSLPSHKLKIDVST